MSRCLLLACCCGALAACPGGGVIPADARAGDGAADGVDLAPPSCPAVPCGADTVCYEGHCVADHGPCDANGDCISDTFCAAGRCVPYGEQTKLYDESCANGGYAPDKLVKPIVKCEWTAGDIRMTPLVVDLDGDQLPEIVFITQPGNLVALHGDSCGELFDVPAGLGAVSQLAIADLTGDGVVEIVGVNAENKVVVLDHQGTLLAEAPQALPLSHGYAAPAIANLDGQAPPEIVCGGMGLRYAGGALTVLFDVDVEGGYNGDYLISAIADVDLDGSPEVIAGNRILDGQTGADETPEPVKGWRGGYVAIAEFDATTPEPEVVLVSSQQGVSGELRIYHPLTGAVVFGPYSFSAERGGPPTVADFDGDGEPEVGVAGYEGYTVFDQQCAAQPLPAFCHGPGVRWHRQTQDFSSASTGSSVFDFNGDGSAEVIYHDECWLRVYAGDDGEVLFAWSSTSPTAMEMPVVADVDNDGHADLVVPSEASSYACADEPDLQLPHQGSRRGILVLQDPQNRWMSSRAIWNQHTYHITNVNDDGTVPLVEPASWLSWNNYRQNVQGLLPSQPQPAADLTAKKHVGIDSASDCVQIWVLLAEVCNRGAEPVPAGVGGRFYRGDPRSGGSEICRATTTAALPPGACELVKCTYADPPTQPIDLWFVADDSDGTVECEEDNNLLHMPQTACPGIDIE